MTGAQIILASASPRRRQLLDQIGVSFRVVDVAIDETRAPGEAPVDYAMRLALCKARAGREVAHGAPGCPVLGADTVVVLGDEVFTKPADRRAALEMLARLSGRTHEVLTAVALVGERESAGLSRSSVTFRAISGSERAAYWETGEPRGKAGGYAIQGRGAVFVADLRGSYSGVVGLPLFETARLLSEHGIDLWAAGRGGAGL